MNYARGRTHIKDGDLVAIRSRAGWFSRLVRWITASPYTHTGVAIWLRSEQIGRRGLYIAEMDGKKAVLTPLSQYAQLDMDVFSCPVARAEACHAVHDVLRERTDYDPIDLVRIAVWKLAHIAMPSVDRNGIVCSTLTARIYCEAGWAALLPAIPAPCDVVDAVKVRPFLCIRKKEKHAHPAQ